MEEEIEGVGCRIDIEFTNVVEVGGGGLTGGGGGTEEEGLGII